MGVKLTKLPELLASELSDRETLLLQLVRELSGVHPRAQR